MQVSRSWEAAKNWFGTPSEKEKEELQKRLSMKQSDKPWSAVHEVDSLWGIVSVCLRKVDIHFIKFEDLGLEFVPDARGPNLWSEDHQRE